MYLEFKDERDKDFLETYKSVISEHGKMARFLGKQQLIEETINHQAKRYYISYEQCSRIIMKLINRKPVIFKNQIKKEMYYSILNELNKKKQESNKPLGILLGQIIYSPAPRFYLSVKSASILFYSLLKNKQI